MAMNVRGLPRRSKTWNQRTQLARHGIQLAFAGFVAYVVGRYSVVPEGSGPGVTSPEAYSPMGGFETAFQYLVKAGQYVPHTHASNIILAGGLVLTTLALRSFFCGWICPLGALQELVTAASQRLQRRVPSLGRAVRTLRGRAAPLAAADRWLRHFKYLVLAWVLAGTAVYGVLVFRDVDPWHALIAVTKLESIGGLVVLIATLLASIVVERAWCRYACPLGAIIGLLSRLSPLKIEREASACLACDVCTKACPVGIPVHTVTHVDSPQCISCLECIGACPTKGGLGLKLVLPGIRKRPHPALAAPSREAA